MEYKAHRHSNQSVTLTRITLEENGASAVSSLPREMPANIVDTDPKDWSYVSEGGATIVFSYHGPPNPDFDGTVLRLRKAHVPLPQPNDEELAAPAATRPVEEQEPDDPTIEYQAKCMSRLIPPEHLPRLETVHLNEDWLKRLVELQNLSRPESRREVDEVDVDRRKGVLATDLVGGNWLAVEIKPKWAFLPSPAHLSEATKAAKTRTCRFCMHNHFRKSKGQIIEMNYCPLDLFSGDEARIKRAIYGLWDSWTESGGSVNNLKVFANGKTVHPSEPHLMLANDVQPGMSVQEIRESFTTALVRTLLATPVLKILAELQRTLDVLDIEGLSQLWRKTERMAPLFRTTFASFFENPKGDGSDEPPSSDLGVSSLFLSEPQPDIADWSDFLDTYLSPSFRKGLDNEKPAPEHLRYYLLAYLLSATFKDCSIIVRLDFLKPGADPEVKVGPQTVTVIDLDPKSMEKLKGWEKLDKDIATFYAQNADKRACVDAFAA